EGIKAAFCKKIKIKVLDNDNMTDEQITDTKDTIDNLKLKTSDDDSSEALTVSAEGELIFDLCSGWEGYDYDEIKEEFDNAMAGIYGQFGIEDQSVLNESLQVQYNCFVNNACGDNTRLKDARSKLEETGALGSVISAISFADQQLGLIPTNKSNTSDFAGSNGTRAAFKLRKIARNITEDAAKDILGANVGEEIEAGIQAKMLTGSSSGTNDFDASSRGIGVGSNLLSNLDEYIEKEEKNIKKIAPKALKKNPYASLRNMRMPSSYKKKTDFSKYNTSKTLSKLNFKTKSIVKKPLQSIWKIVSVAYNKRALPRLLVRKKGKLEEGSNKTELKVSK
ncbi:hypothetical protein OAB57_03265, partial [Bacteriovoracaceae bacterium]|nr:hypothetical protein [Bacteriovoracaceae bacterium]